MRALIVIALLSSTLSACTTDHYIAKDYEGLSKGVFPLEIRPRRTHHEHTGTQRGEHRGGHHGGGGGRGGGHAK